MKPTFTKEEIIEEIKNGTPFGLEILKIELDYYKNLFKEVKE